MVMIAFPFTSEVTHDEHGRPQYDRAVGSEVLRNIFLKYWSNGVFGLQSSSCFQVLANANNQMNIKVLPGSCMIQGATAYDTQESILQLEASDTSLSRIDTVVLRLDDNKAVRNIQLKIIKGTPASVPIKPELTRNSSIYEIGLADILVRANVQTIVNADITDTRLDKSRCGFVTAGADINPDDFLHQMQSALDEYLHLVNEAVDGTLAGNLQNQLEALQLKDTQINDLIEQMRQDFTSNESVKTLLATNWNQNIYDLAIPEVKADSIVEILPILVSRPTPTQTELENNEILNGLGLQDAGQTNGHIYLYASEIPTKNVQIRVIVKG